MLRLPVDDALKLSDRFVSYPIGLLCAFEGEVECSRSAALARVPASSRRVAPLDLADRSYANALRA